MDIILDIKKVIDDKHIFSNGTCGTYIPKICDVLNCNYETIKPFLTQLYKENYLMVRSGVNGKLIFKK